LPVPWSSRIHVSSLSFSSSDTHWLGSSQFWLHSHLLNGIILSLYFYGLYCWPYHSSGCYSLPSHLGDLASVLC
jgi:hypothetical protein